MYNLANYIEIRIMSQAYTPKGFILQTTPLCIVEYFKKNNVPIAPPDNLNDEEMKDWLCQFFRDLNPEARSQVEADFQVIHSMASNEATHRLIEEAHDANDELPQEEIDKLNQHDKAFWFFFNKPNLFDKVAIWHEVDDKSGWKELPGIKKVKLDKVLGKEEQLKALLQEYLQETELRGKTCEIECYQQEHRVCYIAYFDDYTVTTFAFDEKRKLQKRKPHNPVDIILFLYYPKEGRLSTKSNGGWKRAKALQKIFGNAVLGMEIDTDNDRVFNLDRLLDVDFEFEDPGDEQFEAVRVKALHLHEFGGEKGIILLNGSNIPGMQPIKDMLREYVRKRYKMHVRRVELQVKVKKNIKKAKETSKFFIRWPDGHNITDNPRFKHIREYIKFWGLETHFERILSDLLSFDEQEECIVNELDKLFSAPIRKWVIDNKIFTRPPTSKTLKEWMCKACNQSHALIKSGNGYFYVCPEDGKRSLPKQSIEIWKFSSRNFLQLLKTSLVIEGTLQEYGDGIMQLGTIRVGNQRVHVFYAHTISQEIINSLATAHPTFLVLHSPQTDMKDFSFQKGHVVISTSDFITLVKGDVVIDKSYVDEILISQHQRVRFNEKNGDLLVDHQNVVQVDPGTPQYNFVMSLWDQFDNPVGHEEIYQFNIDEQSKIQGVDANNWEDQYTPQTFSHTMKSLIKKRAPDKTTQELIDKIFKTTRTTDGKPAYRLTNPL